MALVIHEIEVLEHVVEDARRTAADLEARQRQGAARELQVGLLGVVEVGVFERAPGYRNPFAERLGSELAPNPA